MNMQDVPKNILDKVKSFKKKWPNIYCVKIKDDYFVFRLLTRGEFSVLTGTEMVILGHVEDFIVKNCLLYPSKY